MEENIGVFYGKNKIIISRDSNFKDLRLNVLRNEKRLIQYFTFKNEQINEALLIRDFPIFKVVMDKNIFCEYKKGQYRCKRCRKYLKLNKLTCQHSNTCRTFYNFKKGEPINEILEGGYFEIEDEGNYSDYSDEIDNIINKPINNRNQRMMNKINEILAKQDKKDVKE